MPEEMINEKSWNEFQKTGLFWLVNSILHVFGWSLVYEYDGKVGAHGRNITRVYPARVKFRGFSSDAQDQAHQMIAQYMADNAQELKDETEM